MISVLCFPKALDLTQSSPQPVIGTTPIGLTTSDEPSQCNLIIFYGALQKKVPLFNSRGQKWCFRVAAPPVTRCSWLGFHYIFFFFWAAKEEREERGFIFFIFSACSQQVTGVSQHCKPQQPLLYNVQSSLSSRWVVKSLWGGWEFQDVGIRKSLQQSKMTRMKNLLLLLK